MKLDPIEKLIMERMNEGVLSTEGFLGQDERHLHEIIESDQEVLQRLGVTCEQIAERLKYFTELSKEAYEIPIIIDHKYSLLQENWRGRVVCPFNHRGSYSKARIELTHLEKNIKVVWTPLNIHFIEEHGFFEGLGSKYRIDPEVLIQAIF